MDPVIGLSLGRIAVGLASLAKPDLAGRLMGVPTSANPQAPMMTRMFGAREIAIGTATVLARGTVRRRLVLAGIGVDGADAASALASVREGSLDKRSGAVMGLVAAGAVAAGAASVVQDARSARGRRKARAALDLGPLHAEATATRAA